MPEEGRDMRLMRNTTTSGQRLWQRNALLVIGACLVVLLVLLVAAGAAAFLRLGPGNVAAAGLALTKTLAVPKEVAMPIAISARVVEAAGCSLELGTCENVFVKGRQEPVRVYAFLGFESEEGGDS